MAWTCRDVEVIILDDGKDAAIRTFAEEQFADARPATRRNDRRWVGN